MAFVLQDVIKEFEESRSLDPIKNLQKKNLVEVAVHFGITPAVGATKSHFLDLIENWMVVCTSGLTPVQSKMGC